MELFSKEKLKQQVQQKKFLSDYVTNIYKKAMDHNPLRTGGYYEYLEIPKTQLIQWEHSSILSRNSKAYL